MSYLMSYFSLEQSLIQSRAMPSPLHSSCQRAREEWRGGFACERGRAVRAGPVPSPLFPRVSRGAVQRHYAMLSKRHGIFPD